MKTMKRKRSSSGGRRAEGTKVKEALARTLKVQVEQLQQVSLFTIQNQSSSSTCPTPSLLSSESSESRPPSISAPEAVDVADPSVDFILSQDFFWRYHIERLVRAVDGFFDDFACSTPDYITPDNQNMFSMMDCNKENTSCPKSPEKVKSSKSKKYRQGVDVSSIPLSPVLSEHQQIVELAEDTLDSDDYIMEKTVVTYTNNSHSYVTPSAIALRCRVMPPPCIKNPYLNEASETDKDPFGNRRSKCAGLFPGLVGGDGLSRYHTDFHEIEQIGAGNFSRVFKVLKRIDGCFYAVKHSTRQLHQDMERRKALMEVQALAALGFHENIVSYYDSWFENEQLYIKMELCDYSLSMRKPCLCFTENEALKALHQIAKALQFIHEQGITHLDVKPDNIYVKNGTYKLGDFGCATRLDKSLPVEEGDARYMPREILNDNYDHLDKVDIFSLGATLYELIRGSPLPEAGPHFVNLREGKLPLLPGHSLQFQNLLKTMVDPDPVQRPSAKDLLQNPALDRVERIAAQGK